jgi:hypothetical protein
MHNTPSLLSLLLAPFVASLTGCSSADDVTPFFVTIDSIDVVQSAVDIVEVNIDPVEPSRDFAFEPTQTYATTQITTEISPSGTFVIRADRTWIDEHATPGTDSFRVEVPLYSVGMTADEVDDPDVQVTFLSSGDRIAHGSGKLPWPLPEGDNARVPVRCQMDFADRCMGGS